MKVIINTTGSLGDVKPFVAIGSALRDRGHEVILLANSEYESVVHKEGLTFFPTGTGEHQEKAVERISSGASHSISEIIGIANTIVDSLIQSTKRAFELICENYVEGETVLVNNIYAHGARFAREKLNAPLLSVVLMPGMVRSRYRAPQMCSLTMSQRTPRFLINMVSKVFYGFFSLFSIIPIIKKIDDKSLNYKKLAQFDWWYSPDCVVGTYPEWFAKSQPDWPSQLELLDFMPTDSTVTQELSEEVKQFLAAGDPPILFTPGSYVKNIKSFYNESADACERLGKRGILLAAKADEIPAEQPPHFRCFGYVPMGTLLPHAAAVAHHGGIGTTSLVLKAGKPQLLLPSMPDQFETTYLLQQLGVADFITKDKYKGPAVAEKLQSLLDSKTVAEQCIKATKNFQSRDTVTEICERVERLGQKAKK